MPGNKITDHQVRKYKQLRLELDQVAAAAQAGISERSARRIERGGGLPSQRGPREWRTRADPLAAVWDTEILPLLMADPEFNSRTLLEEIQRRHPGEYPDGTLRTLQRRVSQWRALHGPEQEVFFQQEHPPGRLGLSDFTDAGDLQVIIAGESLDHRLYQFVLAHSGWRFACIVTTGESFVALSSGLQEALWRLGGSPEEHRTDSLSAAFKNLAEEHDLTQRYEALCSHYGMRPSRNNRGCSNENGSVETRHGSLKRALDQELRLRGTRDFNQLGDYKALIDTVVARMNHRIERRLRLERELLRPLPRLRTAEYDETQARVTKHAAFTVRDGLYSAPSRLIGRLINVRIYANHFEGWNAGTKVVERPRVKRGSDHRRTRSLDYRHLVGALKRKPGAFARWVLRDDVFPREVYRQTWERLEASVPERQACKTMVGLLGLAADGHEAELAELLTRLIEADQLPDLEELTKRLAPTITILPTVVVQLPTLASYDALLEMA